MTDLWAAGIWTFEPGDKRWLWPDGSWRTDPPYIHAPVEPGIAWVVTRVDRERGEITLRSEP